jgi:hypothetical protein
VTPDAAGARFASRLESAVDGMLSCLTCGHGFRPSGRRVFCSPACRQRAFRLRHPHRARLPNKAIITPIEIPAKHDPRLVDGTATQRQRLAQLDPAQRSALLLDRYPELRVLPSCDWRRMCHSVSKF